MIKENEFNKEALTEIAKKMAIAARTAPKSRGIDNIEIAIADDEDINKIIAKMDEISIKENQDFFARDAKNLKDSAALLLLGVKINPVNLPYCGICGMKNCETKNKKPGIPCAFNTIDLGIAIGSAASVAMDNRVDNRVMYTVGIAARDLELMSNEIAIVCGIPLSAKGKNIYFDRK